MHKNKMNEAISTLRKQYNLNIDSPFRIEINGKELVFECLIKGYGAKNGMVVDSSWEKINSVSKMLVELGYGFSCMDIDNSSIEGFSEVLADWGKVSA